LALEEAVPKVFMPALATSIKRITSLLGNPVRVWNTLAGIQFFITIIALMVIFV
jgi:hypothetical protein